VSLAFLTPDVTRSRELHARSPMERPAAAAGARFSRVEGWNVPNAYSEPSVEWARLTRTVGFLDRSSLTKLELQADPRQLASIVAGASHELAAHVPPADQGSSGLMPELGRAGRSLFEETGVWWCPVTPGRMLVLCEPSSALAVREALMRAAADAQGTATVIDVTCGLAALALIGPAARELLARFCAIDVRPELAAAGAFRPGSIARTPGYLLVEAPERLLVLVGWALGDYLWQVVADAATALGGGPVGAEALSHLLERDDA
jgi:heterotetrameric sarcosine oxidase gamma subunit